MTLRNTDPENTDLENTDLENPDLDARADAYGERLDALLRALPREAAGDDFTDAVLDRLPANDDAPGLWRGTAQPWQIAVAALFLIALALGWVEWRHQQERAEAIERIAELRAEYTLLERQLQELRDHTAQGSQVVYLGEVDGTEVVLDLARLPDNGSRMEALRLLRAGLVPSVVGADPAVRPAVYEPTSAVPVSY